MNGDDDEEEEDFFDKKNSRVLFEMKLRHSSNVSVSCVTDSEVLFGINDESTEFEYPARMQMQQMKMSPLMLLGSSSRPNSDRICFVFLELDGT